MRYFPLNMSKKKNSKHLKNQPKPVVENEVKAHKIAGLKNIYEDPFLGKSVELAPNAYEVYTEKNAKPTNALVVRKDATTTYDTKNNKISEKEEQKIKLAETKIDDVLSSLGSDGKKQVVDEIFKNINKEKADFDNKIKQTEAKANPETLFDKIYTKEFVKQERTGFFGKILDVLNSDIVWTSVAVSLILGVLLFYFQGLQPALLDNYSTKAKNQSNDLVTRYSNQVSGFFTASNTVAASYTYEQGILCSKMKTYENVSADLETVSNLQFSVFSDQKLKNLDNYSYFYSQEIKDAYTKLYNNYSNKLDSYIQPISDLKDYIRFLQFRNNMIKNCGEIEAAGQTLDKIRPVCAGMLVQFNQFKDGGLPSFWSGSKIETAVNFIESSCNSLAAPNVSAFIKDFFVQFDEIIFYKPDLVPTNEALVNSNQEFAGTNLNTFKKEVSDIVKNKSNLLNSFYILNIEL